MDVVTLITEESVRPAGIPEVATSGNFARFETVNGRRRGDP
jgi:hypothetical protein